jgi:hypothetical protein
MPAPKQFKPGPEVSHSRTTTVPPNRAKGRYAVVSSTREPRVAGEETVEIDVDDVTIMMQGTAMGVSKYRGRSLHAHVEPGLSIEIDETPEPAEPVRNESMMLGEWRSDVHLDGRRYRRKDSRLP